MKIIQEIKKRLPHRNGQKFQCQCQPFEDFHFFARLSKKEQLIVAVLRHIHVSREKNSHLCAMFKKKKALLLQLMNRPVEHFARVLRATAFLAT